MIDKAISRIVGFGLCALVLSSCSSAPKREASTGVLIQARWETKLRVRDIKRDKVNNVSVDVLGRRNGPLRMEATAILGYPVASYVMDQSGFKCAVYPEKKFYEGGLSPSALQPLLKFPLSPLILRQIAFDEAILGDDWICARGMGGRIDSCASAALQTRVHWKREPGARTVRVDAPGFELDWVFGMAQTDVQFQEATFQLEAPKGFKVIRL